MTRLVWTRAVLVWVVCVSASAAVNADPVVDSCKGPLSPSVTGGCEGIGSVGCCDVFGRALWCDKGDLYCLDCAAEFPACGWNPFGYYDCGQGLGEADPTGANPLACGDCSIECGSGAACSSACPGSCGSCDDGVCLDDGTCYTPQCAGKACGKDPLGFTCGTCAFGTTCVEGSFQCLAIPEPCLPSTKAGCDGCSCETCVCELHPTCCTDTWDTFCAAACELECGMNCSACPAEPNCDDIGCGTYCGVDCGSCGDGEFCFAFECCAPSCAGKVCGSDGCGSSCGSCEGTDDCVAGECVPCQPKCQDKECGEDGCGSSCGSCNDDEVCVDGACVTGLCDGECDGGSQSCGDGCWCYCDETCFLYDDCCPGLCESCPFVGDCCVPDCGGLECGDDGCLGTCGSCEAGTRCEVGLCAPCEPVCEGKSCGDDTCNGTCGECPTGEVCENFKCVPCEPQCEDRECGDDGCDGSCGACDPGGDCVDGQCAYCESDCDGKDCGDDGCGESCGDCLGAQKCVAFSCVGSADPCKGISFEGCCDGERNNWCADGTLQEKNCAHENLRCGWVPDFEYYGCAQEPDAEPSGIFPMLCPQACVPACDGRICGDDGCGGSCGECEVGGQCTDGACVIDTPTNEPNAEAPQGVSTLPEGDSPEATTVEANDTNTGGDGCSAGPPFPLWLFILVAMSAITRRILRA